jgi:hypothetical protein
VSVKWWEKTVEYLFVKKHVNEESLIIPFDGKEELQSDSALCVASRWILIEFKKEKNSFSSEKKKFYDFTAAYEKLHKLDSHHHIIYGSPIKNDGSINLILKSQRYFSQQPNDSIESLLMSGIEFEAFRSYLKDFVSFKKKTDEDAGGVVLDTNSNVVGVTASGKIVECKSMKEYVLEYCPELAPPPPVPPPPQGSTMRRR